MKNQAITALCLSIILLPLLRVDAVASVQSSDYLRHRAKINELYFNVPLPEEASYMDDYPTLIHSVLGLFMVGDMDNLLFVYSGLLCATLVVFRLLFFELLSRVFKDQLVVFWFMLAYFELPYILPTVVSVILDRVLWSFPLGFWSFELTVLYGGMLPYVLSVVASMAGLLWPQLLPFVYLFVISTSKFSGLASFLCFLGLFLWDWLKRDQFDWRVLGLVLALGIVFIPVFISGGHYIIATIGGRDDRLFTFVLLFVVVAWLYSKRSVKSE